MTDPRESIRGTRREFLVSSAAVTGGLLASPLPAVHAAGDETIKVGLIGCGGRGTGAARDCAVSSPGVKIVAVGDAFADRIEAARGNLKRELGDKFDVPDDRCFVGFDAYKKVLDAGIDLVILATPPGFRPICAKAAPIP